MLLHHQLYAVTHATESCYSILDFDLVTILPMNNLLQIMHSDFIFMDGDHNIYLKYMMLL